MTSTYADLTAPAALARSILSCPAEVDLVVEGVPHPLADDARLPMQDLAGVPTFACSPGGALARAGADRLPVVVTISSGLGDARSPLRQLRATSLALAGRLRLEGRELCECCAELRDRLVVDLDLVALVRGTTRTAIAVEDFLDPALQLNAGYLQRAVEHANSHHAEELRHAAAARTGVRPRKIAAAHLGALTPRSVELSWITADGGNRTVLRFPTSARTPDQLADLLRRALHPGLR